MQDLTGQHQNQESQPALNASSNSLYKQFFEKVKKAEVEEVISMVNQMGLDIANLQND